MREASLLTTLGICVPWMPGLSRCRVASASRLLSSRTIGRQGGRQLHDRRRDQRQQQSVPDQQHEGGQPSRYSPPARPGLHGGAWSRRGPGKEDGSDDPGQACAGPQRGRLPHRIPGPAPKNEAVPVCCPRPPDQRRRSLGSSGLVVVITLPGSAAGTCFLTRQVQPDASYWGRTRPFPSVRGTPISPVAPRTTARVLPEL